jgi:hypothetical protein
LNPDCGHGIAHGRCVTASACATKYTKELIEEVFLRLVFQAVDGDLAPLRTHLETRDDGCIE